MLIYTLIFGLASLAWCALAVTKSALALIEKLTPVAFFVLCVHGLFATNVSTQHAVEIWFA
jgi:hypothetical protein